MADIVSGFREVIQDLLVPELKAVQVEIRHQGESIKALQQEMKGLREEVNKRFEEVNKRFEEVNKRFEEVNKRFEMLHEEILDLKMGQKEILAKLEVEKRVTKLEAVLEEVKHKVFA